MSNAHKQDQASRVELTLDLARTDQALKASREHAAQLLREKDQLMRECVQLRAELERVKSDLEGSGEACGRLDKALKTQARRADLAERYSEHVARSQMPDLSRGLKAADSLATAKSPQGTPADHLSTLLDCEEAQSAWTLRGTPARAEALELVKTSGRAVSVIMPTFNRAPTIARAVRSALDQTVRIHEVVLADDASTDDTLELLERTFPAEIAIGRLVVLRGEKGGVCAMRNKAIEAATGNVVAFLDSDNHWHPDHLLWALAAMEFSGARSAYTGANLHNLSEHWSRTDCAKYDRTALLKQNFIDLNCFAHRVDDRLSTERFDLALSRLVDWDYIIRITGKAAPARVPVATVEYFLDQSGLNNISLTAPLKENAERIQLKHRAEMRKHKVLSATAEARLEALSTKTRSAEAVQTYGGPTTGLPDVAHPGDAAAPGEQDSPAMPYFGGLPLFVVLPNAAAPPDKLPLEFVRPRFIHLLGAGKWNEIDRSGQILETHDRLPAGNYWFPDPHQDLPTAHQIATLVAATHLTEIDMAVASLSLDAPPIVTASCLRNQLVLRENHIEDFASGRLLSGPFLGKVLRIPQGPADGARTADLGELLGRAVSFHEKSSYFTFEGEGEGEGRWPSMRNRPPAETIPPSAGRLRVLVLAQKLAVGGVERNTIEISRELARDHDCIYLTLEKVRSEQGSLCHQAVEACASVLDVAEIAHHGIYPELLQQIVDVYAPDILWICNGSMWLCENATEVRDIFAGSGIVDQQVYDTEEGWIRRYSEPGIQSFDRFIAINRKIQSHFIDRIGMDPERVDLIYSAINAKRFRDALATHYDRSMQRKVFGLPQDKTILAFMGRLVDQKRPLDFLDLARLCRNRDDLHFVLTGDGILGRKVENYLDRENLANVTWIRNVVDTTTFWPAIDGYVVTSEYEGLPIALIEAISLGVPALATDVGDIRYVLETYGAGQVVDASGGPEQFAEALGPFLADLPEAKARLAERGGEIIDFFSAETLARQFAESFRRASDFRRTSVGP